MLLTDKEIQDLTRKKNRPAQSSALRSMRIEHTMRPDGSIVVLRDHVNIRLGGVQKTYIKEPEPNWDGLNA